MAIKFDNYDNSLIVSGWEQGVADDPTSGISDMRNANIVSIPGEASVNFATAAISSPIVGSTVVTGLSANAISFAAATGLENGMAIKFTTVGGLTGIALNTTYWVQSSVGSPVTSCKLYSDYSWTTTVVIGGAATGTPTFKSFNIGELDGAFQEPKYFTYTNSTFNDYYMIDGLGQTWSNHKTTPTNGYWTYTGLSGTADVNNGKGLAFYQSTKAGNGYVFAFLGTTIDYFSLQSYTWTYGWKPATGTTHQTGYLNSGGHEAVVMPTNQLVFCDGQYIGRFYETNPATDFDPTNTATYVYDSTQLLPGTDRAVSLAYLGTNVVIGGQNNVIYPWNGTATTFNYPILLPEYNVKKLVTVNTTTYIFVGNRGRIYYTNGTNAQLFKKVPDHISGTVEPYFTWGGAISVKNQLYFSAKVTTNAGTAINQYGGIWAIDLDTKAIRLTNKLSYATYAGYASALIPNFGTNPAGTGLFIGWDDNASHYGIDQTISTPYVGSQATIDSDLIPIGTYNKPRDVTMLEYKLTRPLVSGESIIIKSRLIFNTTDTGYTTVLTDTTAGNFAGTAPINFQQAQWVQFQIVLNSTATNPSYTRLRHIRVLGLTGPTMASAPQLGL